MNVKSKFPTQLFIGLFVFFIGFSAKSQTYVKAVSVGPLTPMSCNNTIVVQEYNMPSLAYSTTNASGEMSGLVSNGDTIYNFCLNQSTPDQVHMFSTNGYVYSYELYSNAIAEYLDFEIYNYIEPSGGSNGSLTIEFDSLQPLGADYDVIIWSPDFTVDTTIVGPTTLQVNSLDEGWILIQVLSTQDPNDFTEVRVKIGDMNAQYVNPLLPMSLSWQHADGNCLGWIQANPDTLGSNYHNVWSNEVYNEFGQVNLCAGIYSVYTFGFVPLGEFESSIDTFVIVDNSTAYIDSSLFQYAVQDTAYFNFENCGFDYNAAIDSIQYSEDTVYQGGGITIITFEMITYQNTSTIAVYDSLVLYNDSLVQLDVVIYCDSLLQKTGNTFNGRRIAYLRGADTHSFSQGVAGLSDESLPELQVYPNPVENTLFIESSDAGLISVQIFDARGSVVLSPEAFENSISIDMSSLVTGVYYAKIGNETGLKTIKVLKQ